MSVTSVECELLFRVSGVANKRANVAELIIVNGSNKVMALHV
jgi:hypothetical protein